MDLAALSSGHLTIVPADEALDEEALLARGAAARSAVQPHV